MLVLALEESSVWSQLASVWNLIDQRVIGQKPTYSLAIAVMDHSTILLSFWLDG
jgi:hypothetical protein